MIYFLKKKYYLTDVISQVLFVLRFGPGKLSGCGNLHAVCKPFFKLLALDTNLQEAKIQNSSLNGFVKHPLKTDHV